MLEDRAHGGSGRGSAACGCRLFLLPRRPTISIDLNIEPFLLTLCLSRCRGPRHPVTAARFGKDVRGVLGIISQFAAQALDQRAHRPQIAVIAYPPQSPQQMPVRQHTPSVARKLRQYPVLKRRQPHAFARKGHPAFSVINRQPRQLIRRSAARIRAVSSVGENGLTT